MEVGLQVSICSLDTDSIPRLQRHANTYKGASRLARCAVSSSSFDIASCLLPRALHTPFYFPGPAMAMKVNRVPSMVIAIPGATFVVRGTPEAFFTKYHYAASHVVKTAISGSITAWHAPPQPWDSHSGGMSDVARKAWGPECGVLGPLVFTQKGAPEQYMTTFEDLARACARVRAPKKVSAGTRPARLSVVLY